MTETILNIKLFYPMLFITISVISIALICTTKSILINFKDKDSQNFNFKTHIDEHKDTTSKMKDITDKVISVQYGIEHEKELHTLELMVKELNKKVDILVDKVANLEKKQ